MAGPAIDAEAEMVKELGQLLNQTEKSPQPEHYRAAINALKCKSANAKREAVYLVSLFSSSFPALATDGMSAVIDVVKTCEVEIRNVVIEWTALLQRKINSKETLSKFADALGQLVNRDENGVSKNVREKLISLIKRDFKNSLEPLFNQIKERSSNYKEIICFLQKEVFPRKSMLFQPLVEKERIITDLIKKSVQDVSVSEFEMFVKFLQSLSLFGDSGPRESCKELIAVIERRAWPDSHFSVSDAEQIERWMSCMKLALPIFRTGASSSTFLDHFAVHIVPAFEKIPEETKMKFLKAIAESSPYAAAKASQLLPSLVELLKLCMPNKKTEDINHTYVECLMYTFFHLANKNPMSGVDLLTHFTERLTGIEDTVQAALKGLTENDYQQTSKQKKQSYNNILKMLQELHHKNPKFISGDKITPSWMEEPKNTAARAAGLGEKKAVILTGPGRVTGRKRAALAEEELLAKEEGLGPTTSAVRKFTGQGIVAGRGRGPWDDFR